MTGGECPKGLKFAGKSLQCRAMKNSERQLEQFSSEQAGGRAWRFFYYPFM
jgi:hypothetical protein